MTPALFEGFRNLFWGGISSELCFLANIGDEKEMIQYSSKFWGAEKIREVVRDARGTITTTIPNTRPPRKAGAFLFWPQEPRAAHFKYASW